MTDLKELTEELLGFSISNDLYRFALKAGMNKLNFIINREGDAAGERRKDYYLAQLIAENVKSTLLTLCFEMQNEKAPRPPASAPKQNITMDSVPHFLS